MAQYQAPIDDMLFTMQAVAGLDRVLALQEDLEAALDTSLVAAVLEEANKVARDMIAPCNHSGDKQGAQRQADGSVTTPDGFDAAFQAMTEGGWMGLACHPEFGGQGLPRLVSTAVSEMWQAANLAFALCPLLTQGAIDALEQAGSEALKQRYLPSLVEGRWTGTMNLTEPQAGSDLAAIRTMATPDGEAYRIKGQKIFITYGEHSLAENIIHLVLARTPGAPEGIKGLSLFLVPKYLVNDDGSLGARNDLICASLEHKLGIMGSPTAIMQYGETGLGDNQGAIGYLVGAEHEGLNTMFIMMNRARFEVGVQGLGAAEAALQHARRYAMDRVQGRPLEAEAGAPIMGHPDVKRLMLGMKAQTEAMRALSYVCAMEMDTAQLSPDAETRKRAQSRADLLVPIVKGWCTELSVLVASDGVQVHGGMGFIEETGAAQFYRDARILPIYEGTTAIQANDLVFRKTLRDQGAAVMALLADAAAETQAVSPAFAEEATLLAASCTRAEQAVRALLAASQRPAAAACGGVNLLMMLGYVTGGWLMLRAGQAAAQGQSADPDFAAAKQATARVYMRHILPKADALATTLMGDASEIIDVPNAWV